MAIARYTLAVDREGTRGPGLSGAADSRFYQLLHLTALPEFAGEVFPSGNAGAPCAGRIQTGSYGK